jgi:NAD(P)-dependent dehydrogenase (short-subunit alcohol dehydrogenase family)
MVFEIALGEDAHAVGADLLREPSRRILTLSSLERQGRRIGFVPTLLIFGARNLGRAIAGHMAELGWSVAAVARSEETVGRLRDELPDALGIAGDAASEDDVERAFDAARERFGSIDLVVVAISPTFRGRQVGGGKVAEADGKALSPYTEELLPALFTVLRVGARRLKEQGVGTFVQITGGSARRGMPGRGPWAAAAFATRALVQSAASELREHGVHVALLIVDATIESEKSADRLAGRAPKESASQEDVARAIAYLAGQSPRAWTHELQLTPSGDRWVP